MDNKKTLLALSLASSLLLTSPATMAHGGSPDYLPIDQALSSSGATYELSDDNSELLITSGEADIRVPLGETQALYNGEPVELSAPARLHDGEVLVERSFVHDLFKDHVPQTMRTEGRSHPLDSLTAEEIRNAAEVVKASTYYTDNMRFTEIRLADPDKGSVWDWYFGGSHDFERHAEFTVLDGRKVIEGTIDLASGDILRWEHIEGAHGMVTFDDFMAVQEIIAESEAYKEALRKRGIDDIDNVVATPLTVGYFQGEDGLEHDSRLLKVVSYLDVGDGNYWAHPIENLVAVVDLEESSILKIEDEGVVPIPMTPRPYDGRDQMDIADVKPLVTMEPEGKNVSMTDSMIHWMLVLAPLSRPLPITIRVINERSCMKAHWAA